MRFKGEIKFPDLDHPGVPVLAQIDGAQFELFVEGETIGRWSLYDVEASRLVASAFLLNLDGEEVTYVAADPIDFAYRGVEHMAETWAQIKAKRLPTRSMAIRMSRRDTIPSRVEDLRAAMEANLAAQAEQRRIAGESAATASSATTEADEELRGDWDDRSAGEGIPVVGGEDVAPVPEPVEVAEVAEPVEAIPTSSDADELAEERKRLEEQRARLEAEAKAAEEREAVRLEAYRLEMERLEAEREEARRLAELVAAKAAELKATEEKPATDEPQPVVEEPSAPDADVEEPVLEEQIDEPVGIVEESDPIEPPETADPRADEEEPESVVDLSDIESEPEPQRSESPAVPEPAMAQAEKDKAGLMGAVKSAFARNGGKTHEHNFLEAPGGLGITRYVCEDCGYVSISA